MVNKKIEITDFECLTNNKLVNEELAFKVKVKAIATQIGFKDMLNFPVKND